MKPLTIALLCLPLSCAPDSRASSPGETTDTGSTTLAPATAGDDAMQDTTGSAPSPSTSNDSTGDGADVTDGGMGSESSGTGGPAGRCGARQAPRGFDPNPVFADLPDATALDLGAYECASRMPQIADHCEKITDYSRFNYDPGSHRVLMFGGGHAATGRTDVDVFEFDALSWNSLYPTMSCDEVAAGELDDRGFHLSSGHPVARHTYDMSVIAQVDGESQLLLLSTEGFAGHCHAYDASIAGVAALPLGDGCPWTYGPQFALPWYYAAAAEFDPISGMVIVMGSGKGASFGGMWVYDPGAQAVIAYVELEYGAIAANLVAYPPNGNLYLFGSDGEVREVVLDRDDWSASSSTLLQPTGPAPVTGETGWAYDAHCEVIGGAVSDNTFHVFDPESNAWTAEAMTAMSDAGSEIGTQTFHMLDYDPVDNVYLVIADGTQGRRTWAYRHRN